MNPIMKPLDDVQSRAKLILEQNSRTVLFPEEIASLESMDDAEKVSRIRDLLTKPIPFEGPEVIYNWHFRNKWKDAVSAVHGGKSVRLLEVGAGCCDMIPKMMARSYADPETKYLTMNLNEELTAEFKRRTKDLEIDIEVIEDDAKNISEYAKPDSFDIVAFEHSANDVIETIIAEKNGIDTVGTSWLEILPPITELVNAAFRDGTFEELVKKEFLELISACISVTRPGGCLVFAHYPFQYNLDIGLAPEFNEFLLPMVRKWITEAGLGEEITVEGFDSPWWLIIRV